MFARFRRRRLHPVLRDLLQETHLSVHDFIYPLFVKRGEGLKDEVASMPGVYQMSIDEIVKECGELDKLGIRAIILFGIPDVKDSVGSEAMCEHSIIADTIRAVKEAYPHFLVVCHQPLGTNQPYQLKWANYKNELLQQRRARLPRCKQFMFPRMT